MKWDLWDGVGFMRCDGIDGMKCQSCGGGTRSDGPRLTDGKKAYWAEPVRPGRSDGENQFCEEFFIDATLLPHPLSERTNNELKPFLCLFIKWQLPNAAVAFIISKSMDG